MQFSIFAAAAVLAASASALSIRAADGGYVPPANLFTFTNGTQLEAAQRYSENCYAQGTGFPRNMQVDLSFRQNQTADQAQFLQLNCTQGRNHGGSWSYTNLVANQTGLQQVYASDGKCNEISYGLCSRTDYDTTVTQLS